MAEICLKHFEVTGVLFTIFLGYIAAQQIPYTSSYPSNSLPRQTFGFQFSASLGKSAIQEQQQQVQQQPQQQPQQQRPTHRQQHQQQPPLQSISDINGIGTTTTSAVPRAPQVVPPNRKVATARNPHYRFSEKLYHIIAPAHSQQNIIFSPISLQTLLAFIYTGSRGRTAEELQRALEIPPEKDVVGGIFENLIRSQQNSPGAQLVMANKLYYDNNLEINRNFDQFARQSFDSETQPIQFSMPVAAAQNINGWVAEKTHNRIQNLISPNALDSSTSAILVNAVYFKAKWHLEFSRSDTQMQNFLNFGVQPKPVEMMFNDDVFRYAQFPKLDAAMVELPYLNTDMSMLIILPNAPNGLSTLEQRLQSEDLNRLAASLKLETVTVRLPKFRIDFELDMTRPLYRMGISELFTKNAQLTDLFTNNQRSGVSKVQHKAFIEVNEAGSEAAAASFAKIVPLSLPARLFEFTVDHPFMFAIRSPQAVYFIGHVTNL